MSKTAMIELLKERGINKKILKVMEVVPREEFVDKRLKDMAYDDNPLPIDYQQTISQPYIVALMTQELSPEKNDKVLEIGTGSGYQAAILSKLAKEVYTIERIKGLYEKAKKNLKGYRNIHLKLDNGFKGWKEKAKFDRIIVTAAPESIPEELIEQLKDNGKMIIPIGDRSRQILYLVVKNKNIEKYPIANVLFVPMKEEP